MLRGLSKVVFQNPSSSSSRSSSIIIIISPKSPTTFKSTTVPMSSSSSKIIAEYAKSNRPSCKQCKKTIDAKAVRLGLGTRDPQRGFDITKWHHFNCLPFTSTDSITGFQSLQNSDQDALKKLTEQSQSEEKVIVAQKSTSTGKNGGISKVFIACGIGKSGDGTIDPFRKPEPGMWHIMEQHFNSGIAIEIDQSFYVGDAAGRPQDHSDADIKFAEAVGLKFYVPEDYFG